MIAEKLVFGFLFFASSMFSIVSIYTTLMLFNLFYHCFKD